MNILSSELYRSDLIKAAKGVDLTLLKGKSVVITGGLGLIGSAIADMIVVACKDADVYIAARSEERFSKAYGGWPRAHFIAYDALRPVDFPLQPDYIIHSAGVATPDLYVKAPVDTMLSNITGILNILEYARARAVERVMYISSSEIYGTDNPSPLEENRYGVTGISSIRASYPVSKQASEMLVKSYFAQYGVDGVIVRPGHIYGPGAGEKDRRVSSDFARKAAMGADLSLMSAGLQKRSYCYAVDAAAAILTALLKGEGGEAYNVGHDESTSILEMAKILAEAGNVALHRGDVSVDTRQFNPMQDSTLSNAKIKALGYRDAFTVREGLCHTVEILKETM